MSVGYTTFLHSVHDFPVDAFGNAIDLNGNGAYDPGEGQFLPVHETHAKPELVPDHLPAI